MPNWNAGTAWIKDMAGNLVRVATLVEEDARPGGGESFNGGTITEPLDVEALGIPISANEESGASSLLRLRSAGTQVFDIGRNGGVSITPTGAPGNVGLYVEDIDGNPILFVRTDDGSLVARTVEIDDDGQFYVYQNDDSGNQAIHVANAGSLYLLTNILGVQKLALGVEPGGVWVRQTGAGEVMFEVRDASGNEVFRVGPDGALTEPLVVDTGSGNDQAVSLTGTRTGNLTVLGVDYPHQVVNLTSDGALQIESDDTMNVSIYGRDDSGVSLWVANTAEGDAVTENVRLTAGKNQPLITATDVLGATIFEVRGDGSVHIKTGTSIVADL